jgi:Tfp pilus assembly protein PilV
MTTRSTRTPPRAGITSLEVLVAATLLTVLIATVAPVAGRIYQISHQTRQYQMATNALANQVDAIVGMPVSEQAAFIESIPSASGEIQAGLPESRWTTEVLNDDSGKRIRVSLHWNAGKREQSVSLIAWLDSKTSGGIHEKP